MRTFRPFWLYRLCDRAETRVICAARFVHRVWRYRSVLAYDYDFDWSPLAEFMELKLRAMAAAQTPGMGVHSHLRARECRVAAELCHRIRTDAAWEMHNGPRNNKWARRIEQSNRVWQEYLGRLIGKRLTWWWG